MRTRQIDVAIVGYGIEGRTVALMLSKSRLNIVAFDAPHPLNLGADSLRNHSVIHYGIQYGEKNRVSAMKMAASGESLHELVGMALPQDGGVLCLTEKEAEKAIEVATSLKLKNKVWELSEATAKSELGPFFKTDSSLKYLRVPETVFPERQIMEREDRLARENGVRVINEKVELMPNPNDNTRCLVATEEEIYEPAYVVLCAGSGLPELFNQIGVSHSLRVFCTPLMRFPFESDSMKTRYFVDKSKEGLSGKGVFVARHDPNILNDGCLVVAKSIRREILKGDNEKRVVLPSEERSIWESLPESLMPFRNSIGYRLIAGYKTELIDEDGQSTIDSQLLSCAQFENVIGVIPGKATLVYDASTQVVDWLEKRMSTSGFVASNTEGNIIDVDVDALAMHYDSVYDGVLDERLN